LAGRVDLPLAVGGEADPERAIGRRQRQNIIGR